MLQRSPCSPNTCYRAPWSSSMETILAISPITISTILFRSIHNKLPTKSLLYRLIPFLHLSRSCFICLSTIPAEKTKDHFFSVQQNWQFGLLCTLPTSPSGSSTTYPFFTNKCHFLSLIIFNGFYLLLWFQNCRPQIFACTLQQIWLFH